MNDDTTQLLLHDFAPGTDVFRQDVLEGLRRRPKQLPCKYFYDEVGSQLFDQICELDEYYLTRTELDIMRRDAPKMAKRMGSQCVLIEYGSGSSIKTRWILEHLTDPVAYVPVDIAREHLHAAAAKLSRRYPDLPVIPVCADFTQPFELPPLEKPWKRKVVYFPGSTIGNFTVVQAAQLLGYIASLVGNGGGLLIGIDFDKDATTLEAAYNDRRGVTAAFNLNLLRRINRQLDADICVESFEHRAVYDPVASRVEMYLVSRHNQVITVAEERIPISEGEAILTEYSHKYRLHDFEQTARSSGLQLQEVWTDDRKLVGVLYLEAS